MYHHELFSTNEIHIPIFKRNTCILFVNKDIQRCQTFMNAGVCMLYFITYRNTTGSKEMIGIIVAVVVILLIVIGILVLLFIFRISKTRCACKF